MIKKTTLLMFVLLLAGTLISCGYPAKSAIRQFPSCTSPKSFGDSLIFGVTDLYFTKIEKDSCTGTVKSYDLSVWHEAPYNSEKMRGLRIASIGCTNLTPASTASQGYKGTPGYSRTVLASYDFAQYPPTAIVKRVIIGFHSPSNANGLLAANLRGRLNVGDTLQNLAVNRTVVHTEKNGGGWVYYDITHFAARAINERRNGVHFELSLPCLVTNQINVDVSVLNKEPLVIVEYK